ncbi:hypothetical protein LIER_17430 [Lithospermum erythrorhizon]|uniref:Uncharacterized protein n=1 Tax=Lithospermum erythrorhizon TaxID=34254 RepID=A0AAV3QCN4_LITER
MSFTDRFTSHSINAIGVVTLDFTIGANTKVTTIRAQFTVVDIEDHSYNGHIGCRILTTLRAIVLPVHLKMKFPTSGGIREVCGGQKKARRCYQTSVPPLNKRPNEHERKKSRENHMEINTVKSEANEDNSPKERESEKRAMPHEEVLTVPFTQEHKERTFRIGTKLGKDHKQRLIASIRELKDVFSWGPEDMPSIDPAVEVHILYIDPTFPRIKQKKRLFNIERNTTIREEVQDLLKAQAIRELKFLA